MSGQQPNGMPDKVMIMTPSTPTVAPDDDIFALPLRSTPAQSSSRRGGGGSGVSVNFNSGQSPFHYSTYQTEHPANYSDDDEDGGDYGGPQMRGPTIVGSQDGSKKQPKNRFPPIDENAPGGTEFVFKPQSKYDMKNHMANERTFFKYLFTGLHIGSIGTLVLTFFPNDDINKLYLVTVIWLVAFGFMFWGLYGYYQRKNLMEAAKLSDASEISPHTPLLISSIFVLVILAVVLYGLFVHYKYEAGLSLSKIFMMGESDKSNRAKRRARRRKRKAARLAAEAAAGNGEGTEGGKSVAGAKNGDVVKGKGGDGEGKEGGRKKNGGRRRNRNRNRERNRDRDRNNAAGFFNPETGAVIEGEKFKPDGNDAQIDGHGNVLHKSVHDSHNTHDSDKPHAAQNENGHNDHQPRTEGASIAPTPSATSSTSTAPVGVPSPARRLVVNEPAKAGTVKIPMTREEGGDLEVDVRDYGDDDDETYYEDDHSDLSGDLEDDSYEYDDDSVDSEDVSKS